MFGLQLIYGCSPGISAEWQLKCNLNNDICSKPGFVCIHHFYYANVLSLLIFFFALTAMLLAFYHYSLWQGPPDTPRDFSCQTRNMREITCTWDQGRDTYLYGSHSSKYKLSEQ